MQPEKSITIVTDDGTTETIQGIPMNGGIMVPLLGIDDEIARILASNQEVSQ